jgi:hypothetical protein
VADQVPSIVYDLPFGADKLYLASRSYVIFVQSVFKNWPRYMWDPDDSVSKIVVMEELPTSLQVQSKLPIISVTSNGGSWSGQAPSQVLHGDFWSSRKTPRTHADIIRASMNILTFAGNDVEASALAWTLFKAIPILREQLQRMDGVGLVEHRLNITKPMDAAGFIRNVTPGKVWYCVVSSPFKINEQTTLLSHKVVKNIIDEITQRTTGS